jgi:hypothetical protein
MIVHARITPDCSAGEPRRSEPRLEAEAEVALRKLGSTGVEARLVNVSSRGFMVECDSEVEAGARVWLSLPGVTRANALIVWSRGGRLGGEFTQPIDPLIVLQAIGQQAAA